MITLRVFFSFALCGALGAQTVTISEQPGIVFVATFGSKLPVAIYSAQICNLSGETAHGSWGEVRQIAEQAGVNVVDNVLIPPTAQRAEQKSNLHKAMEVLGYVGLATATIALFHGAPAWVIESGAGLTGTATLVKQALAPSEQSVQNAITTGLAALADPTAEFTVSNGACTTSKLLLGNAIKNFAPIHAALPRAVNSQGPATAIHPADDSAATWEGRGIEYVAFAH